MDNLFPKELLPKVAHVLLSAEAKIKSLTGVDVLVKIDHNPNPAISFEKKSKHRVMELVCKEFNTTWFKITGDKRYREVVEARHAYMYIMHCLLKQTLQETANDCLRDHTTVISAKQKILGYYDTGDFLTQRIENIKQKLIAENILPNAAKAI